MRYLSFGLKNFKGIKGFNLKLDSNKPISLIGLNESGKTTILEGIYHIGQHCQSLVKTDQLEKPLLTNGQLVKIKPKNIPGKLFTGEVEFTCKISSDNNEEVKAFSFLYAFENDKYTKYSIQINNSNINFGEKESIKKMSEFSKKIPDILFYSDFNLEVPESIKFYTSHYKKTLSSGVLEATEQEEKKEIKNSEWQKILQDIFDSLQYFNGKKNIPFQKNVVDYLDGESGGNVDNFDDILTGISQHIHSKITDKWLGKLKQNGSLKEIKLDCNDKSKNISERNFSFKVIGKNGGTFSLSDRSKGCRWFFAFMLFTEFRKYRKKNTIFLLDEPASNLHASIQEKVVIAINELCDSKSGTFAIYSTHSPYLLHLDYIDNMYIVHNVNASSEVREPKIEINKYDSNKKHKNNEYKPMADYLKLNFEMFLNNKIDFNKYYKFIKNFSDFPAVIEKFEEFFKNL